jgi:uncharacterized protein YlxW (UPF0749 family)
LALSLAESLEFSRFRDFSAAAKGEGQRGGATGPDAILVFVRHASSRWPAAVALFLVGVGFLVATQLRSRQPLRQAATLPTWRLQELAVLVHKQDEARKLLEVEVESLRRQTQDYEAAVAEGRGLSEAMARELAQLRLVLALVPVMGPGVSVTVHEGPARPGGILPVTLEAQDLSGLANELWSAGAEAMAINGIRTQAATGVQQTKTGIVLGGARLSPPYRLEAIGDPDMLLAALAIRGGFVDGLRAVGLRLVVQRQPRLRLTARAAPDYLRFAKPPVTP